MQSRAEVSAYFDPPTPKRVTVTISHRDAAGNPDHTISRTPIDLDADAAYDLLKQLLRYLPPRTSREEAIRGWYEVAGR
jgi:hypothetical protein